jgi:hypothetical protein
MILWKRALTVGLFWFVAASTVVADPNVSDLLTGITLRHKWTGTCEADGCKFRSDYKPPFPFDYTKTEAILMVSVDSLRKPTTLHAVLKREVAGIRADEAIADYLEEDHEDAVEDGIATYKEKILGKTVGFIKYRAYGPIERGTTPTPFTVIHSISVTPDAVAYTHLISFFGLHEDEIRDDQQTLIRALIQKFKT